MAYRSNMSYLVLVLEVCTFHEKSGTGYGPAHIHTHTHTHTKFDSVVVYVYSHMAHLWKSICFPNFEDTIDQSEQQTKH